mmetsp:Transcript_28522/g.69542  ORF Transcript_28522/g.69542 Transcript_28522/m.69542 type:complete len:378 (-) Transcript_28522:87-1220(-)
MEPELLRKKCLELYQAKRFPDILKLTEGILEKGLSQLSSSPSITPPMKISVLLSWASYWKARSLANLGKKSQCRRILQDGIKRLESIAQHEKKGDSTEIAEVLERLGSALRRCRNQSKSRSPRRGGAKTNEEGEETKGRERGADKEVEDTGMLGLSEGKFPSIPHLDFSPQVHADDIQLDCKQSQTFIGVEVVVTEKLDGGNCCLCNGSVFARTHKQPAKHPSFSPVKALYASIRTDMDDSCAYFGENMVAEHSIKYTRIRSPFYLFSIRGRNGDWKSWDDVVAVARKLNIPHAPIVFRGTFKDTEEIKKLMDSKAKEISAICTENTPEGFVIRIAKSFSDEDFRRGKSIAKYVRKGHCQTSRKWGSRWIKNVIYRD